MVDIANILLIYYIVLVRFIGDLMGFDQQKIACNGLCRVWGLVLWDVAGI